MKKQTLEDIDPVDIQSIKMTPEELRKIGDFDDKTNEELEKMSDFLARYSVIIYRVLQTAKREGRLEEISKL